MRRVLVIGCPGTGKSTLTRALAETLGLPAVYLDRLWWKSGWINRTRAEFDARLDAALGGGDVFPAVGAETTPYQDGDVVKLGKMDIEVLHTPGHTPGGVTLKVGDVLLTGDTLFQGSMGRTDFEGGSYAEIMASLGRLGRLSGDYHVLPGHMGASTLEQERKTNYYLREAMEG